MHSLLTQFFCSLKLKLLNNYKNEKHVWNWVDFSFYWKKNYLQSSTARVEEWRLKQKDTEEWMNHRQLPEELQQRVRRFVQYKWLTTRGVDEEAILRALPLDLRRQIQRHLCLDIVRRVSIFLRHYKITSMHVNKTLLISLQMDFFVKNIWNPFFKTLS